MKNLTPHLYLEKLDAIGQLYLLSIAVSMPPNKSLILEKNRAPTENEVIINGESPRREIILRVVDMPNFDHPVFTLQIQLTNNKTTETEVMVTIMESQVKDGQPTEILHGTSLMIHSNGVPSGEPSVPDTSGDDDDDDEGV